MNIGILGLGPVGRSFVYVSTKYGEGAHRLYVYDSNPDKMRGLSDSGHVNICGCEEEVGEESDFLLCCTDMLSGHALTKAARAMRYGCVVSDDFSAKTPAHQAYRASGRQLPYWSIHTMFAPSGKGFRDQLVVEIPVVHCTDDSGTENPNITEFRQMLVRAGAGFRRILSVRDHDRRMGRIQGATSAENICTAATLAALNINPMNHKGVYSNELDRTKFQMALRAIGEKGSSNPRVYGLIAMMNPYSAENIAAYLGILDMLTEASGRGEAEVNATLEQAVESLGYERVKDAAGVWERSFGAIGDTGNSYSSHLAEALLWSRSEYPLEIFAETPSPPYRMREVMALAALSRHGQCARNMCRGDSNDADFLATVRRYREWTDRAVAAVGADPGAGWDQVGQFERLFFDPVRASFAEDLVNIGPKTNELIARLK